MSKNQTVVNKKQFTPSRKLGQNFLIDTNVMDNIVKAIDLNNIDVIIEVGPGQGVLTDRLIQSKIKVIAIELDKRLFEYLQKKFKSNFNIQIINDDVLNIDFKKLTKWYRNPLLVANLPYSISTPMLLKFLRQNHVNKFYCMLQDEFVERIIAHPNTREYNGFSALVQTYASTQAFFRIPPTAFNPRPKINSRFIVLEKKRLQFDEKWARFLRLCFAHKRKTLVNNLKQFVKISMLHNCLEILRLNHNTRAEALSPQQLWNIYQLFEEKTSGQTTSQSKS